MINSFHLKLASLKRHLLGGDSKIIREYLNNNQNPMLHLGCGGRLIADWLNTDINPSNTIAFLDARKSFPFRDNTFVACYSEHMLEHIDFFSAKHCINEIYRTLRPGGFVRLVTPDLDKLISLCCSPRDSLSEAYITYMSKTFEIVPCTPYGILNAHFRLWGHTYLFDKTTLAGLLVDAGFTLVKSMHLDESCSPHMGNLSNKDRYPDNLLDYESFVLEAIKPPLLSD